MRIKKYVVESLPEAMQQIRSDLGHEAIILNTKKIKTKGFLGFFRKQQIEVIAALDPEKKERVESIPIRPSNSIHSTSSNVKPSSEPVKKSIQVKAEADSQEVISEIKNMKKYLVQLLTDKEQLLSPSLEHAKQCLKHHDLLNEVSVEIMSNLLKEEEQDLALDKFEIISRLKEEIKKFIIKYSQETSPDFAKVISFIGPTGVGKTTTIAKIAAKLLLKDKKKVGFITTDTYRIAAVEQLKTYAGILGMPVEVIYSPADLTHALKRLETCDYILMDTAGRNYLEKEYVDELKQLLGSIQDVQTNLVVSLTAKYSDVQGILEKFKGLKIDSILFTKLDETRSYGNILNLVYEYGYPVTYLTNGQNVPDDIILATPKKIADLIVGEEAHA